MTPWEKRELKLETARAWVGAQWWPEVLRAAFLDALDLDNVTDSWCPSCNSRVKVRYPNYAAFWRLVREVRLARAEEAKTRESQWEFNFKLAGMSREEAEAIFEAAADAVYDRTQDAVGHFSETDAA